MDMDIESQQQFFKCRFKIPGKMVVRRAETLAATSVLSSNGARSGDNE
jgi:hypothetical protein